MVKFLFMKDGYIIRPRNHLNCNRKWLDKNLSKPNATLWYLTLIFWI